MIFERSIDSKQWDSSQVCSSILSCLCGRKYPQLLSARDELEEKVRHKAIKEFGIKKGYLSNAVIRALEAWIKE
jgi:hypothetical protein